MSENVQKVITLAPEEILAFCGHRDANLKRIQKRVNAKVVARGNELRLTGSPGDVETAHSLMVELLEVHRTADSGISPQQIKSAADHFESAAPGRLRETFLDSVKVALKGRTIAPLSPRQKIYLDAIRQSDVVFGIGPAGTGKSYLAVAMAVSRLMAGEHQRIILVRPAVEAGERLGFLPGDIAQKFDPYVRPLYDALYEMIEAERITEFVEKGTIEIAPLAYMRGRTLNNSFIILDEAQNTSIEQMKMFLTRLGFNSKAVITGDITQIDLPRGKPSGLVNARDVLKKVDGIEFVDFTGSDVVRHPLVQRIVQAYDKDGRRKK